MQTQAVIDGVCMDYAGWELARELSLMQVSDDVLNRPFNTLSNGEQTKVLLAALFLNDNNFLLIDEPTNHLDMQGRHIVSQYLSNKSGFILVSHDRMFLDGSIDHILSINRANIEVQRGNFSSWLENKQRQDNFELAENKKLQKDIKRLKQAARQNQQWADKVEITKKGKGAAGARKKGEVNIDTMAYNAEKSRRMQQRRKNLERRQQTAIDKKSSLLKNLEKADNLKLVHIPYHKDIYISLKDVSLFYGKKCVCESVCFEIKQGDRIALSGKNGSGKSSIIKLICGEDISYTGRFEKGHGLRISYVSQDTSFLSGNLTDFAIHNHIDESLFKAILRKLDLPRVQLDKNLQDFSSGQKKKVLIAKSLCDKAHLLVWDEPLNFIDVLSRIQIETLLLEYAPTILFVEHDRMFCEKIATKHIKL